ncbi:phosphotransferase [Spongiactinospora sp. TRM90649]|uniref:phosphotransferase n=1 Tax=Spongiactinospora sp. TRM90649 TaxID=3031114 RepID=UPI0023F9F8AC|nr:phosphotransferase [Spongiactinospora sp. TRM90649]MDF5757412.1 phosphotransferase [Spongiactinospora sp. TRM90649]
MGRRPFRARDPARRRRVPEGGRRSGALRRRGRGDGPGAGPDPKILWHRPPVLAIAAVPGTALGRLGEPSPASPAAWAAAGAAIRRLRDAPLPPGPGQAGRGLDELAANLDGECEWLVTNGVLPADLVTRNRQVAEAALRPWTPVFTHGDLRVDHVFVDGDEITGVIDWSEAGQGDALYDLATLTLGHEEHLGDVVAGRTKPPPRRCSRTSASPLRRTSFAADRAPIRFPRSGRLYA